MESIRTADRGTDRSAPANQDVFEAMPLTALRNGDLGPDPGLPTFTVDTTGRRIQVRELECGSPGPGQPALKVAYAQVKTEPGYLEDSVATHKASIREAYLRGCDMVQFPELSITNYCCHDLFLDRTFLKAQRAWLDEVVKSTADTPGITAVVGFVDVDWSKTRPGGRPWAYNALAVIRDGEILDVVHKKLLPNYSIFDEWRWFTQGTETKVFDIKGVKVGFAICEDIWTEGYDRDPVKELIDKGAQFISHSAASPIHVNKNHTRADLGKGITDQHHVPFGSVNMVGCYDGYEGDVPFDGRGLVRSKEGKWLGMGSPFREELLIVDPFNSPESKIRDLAPVQELYFSAVTSVQDYFNRLDRITGKKNNAIFGDSGGIDSGIIGVLLADAIGPDRVYGVSLPTKFNSKETKEDARTRAEAIGIHFEERSIQGFYEAGLASIPDVVANDPTNDHRISQNMQARLRTVVLQAIAMMRGGIMINTGNKTERFTNNFTIYADSAGTIGPIADFDKDRIYDIALFLNKLHGKEVVPQSMITREASAELDYNQVDANVMGDKPELVAPHVRYLIENGINDPVTARSALPESVPDALIKRWFAGIGSSEWKGRQITPGTRVTPVAHGFGRRIPINHGWKGQMPKAA